MHEFESRSEPVFDDREQQEIIAVAARLQREAGQSMTLTELERVATEAGIEPRFVREAVRRRSTASRESLSPSAAEISSTHLFIWSGALLFAQGISIVGALAYGPKLLATIFATAVGLLFGLFASRLERVGRLAALVPAAATFVNLVIFALAGVSALQNSEIAKILFSLCLAQGLLAWAVVWISNWRSARKAAGGLVQQA